MQRTTAQLVTAIVASMQILENMAHGDDSHRRNLDTCAQLHKDAQLHAPAPEDQPLIDQLTNTLDMQLKRESGQFHIPGEAAVVLWHASIAAGEAYLQRA